MLYYWLIDWFKVKFKYDQLIFTFLTFLRIWRFLDHPSDNRRSAVFVLPNMWMFEQLFMQFSNIVSHVYHFNTNVHRFKAFHKTVLHSVPLHLENFPDIIVDGPYYLELFWPI